MRLDRRTFARLILLVCVTLLVTRVAGNHLHLCFDGSEPPVALHALDIDHGMEQAEHNDQDIDLPSLTLAKIASVLLDSAQLLPMLLCVGLLTAPQRVRLEFPERPLWQPLLHLLRPPLRGPPSFLLH